MDDILKQYGVESKKADPDSIQAAVDSGEVKEGQIYVASACNGPKGVRDGIHTFEIVYSPETNPDKPWIVYNRYSSSKELEPYATFAEIFDGRVGQINQIEMEQDNEQ